MDLWKVVNFFNPLSTDNAVSVILGKKNDEEHTPGVVDVVDSYMPTASNVGVWIDSLATSTVTGGWDAALKMVTGREGGSILTTSAQVPEEAEPQQPALPAAAQAAKGSTRLKKITR